MNNEAIFIILALINFALIAVAFRFFGKKGIIGYIILSVIAANMQVNKGIFFDFGFVEFEATLGNIMFAGIFLATDLLSEKYGYKEAKKAVNLSIFANLAFILLMFIATLFEGLEYSSEYNNALDLFFKITSNHDGGMIKTVLVGNSVYFISQTLDVYVYSRLKAWNDSKATLWIRNNGSTFVSQLVDTILVTVGFGFVGVIPMDIVGAIIFSTLIIKYLAALLDTPFMYLMNMITPLNDN